MDDGGGRSRVIAIAPAVIDMLNVEPSFIHHWRAYGAWSDAVKDYVEQGIMDWIGTPQFRALMKIEEPYEYRDRLTMPKLLVNATGDQFFLPDSSQFYFDDLPGEKHLRYVPNADHSLDKTDALENVQAFYAVDRRRTRRGPQIKWTFERDGVDQGRREGAARTKCRLWQAVNPTARNFRLDVIGPAYTSTVADALGPEHVGGAASAAPPTGLDGVFRRADVPDRRQVSAQGDDRRSRAARHAAVSAACSLQGRCSAPPRGESAGSSPLESSWRLSR